MQMENNEPTIAAYAYGFKLGHEGAFVELGHISFPLDTDMDQLNDPEFIKSILDELTVVLVEAIGNTIIPTIRPMDEDFYDDTYL